MTRQLDDILATIEDADLAVAGIYGALGEEGEMLVRVATMHAMIAQAKAMLEIVRALHVIGGRLGG